MKFFSPESVKNDLEVSLLWQKAKPIPNLDPNEWRFDHLGARIRFDDYGNRDSEFGWERDHVITIADGGTDDIDNLRPLQWRNNLARNKTKGRSG